MPALKVLEFKIRSVSMRHRMVVRVATLSMMIKMALVVFISGVVTSPMLGLLMMA
ncbi:hypothetical protein D3C73_611490 [compost metagenome]